MLEGDFSFIQTESHRNMLQAAYDAISNVIDGWEFLKNYSPPPDKGFMFCESPQKLKDINEAIENGYNDHTGYTYSWTMRQMECIAKKGWDRYVNGYHPKYRITWVMDSGYSGYGEPVFKSLDDATDFVKSQMIQDAIRGWKIQYKIECV